MKLNRIFCLVAALSLFSGCAVYTSEPVISKERVGVCSWSYQLPMRQVIERMEASGVKNVNLALIPFIDNDKYHGGSESAETWAWLKAKVQRGEIVVCSTMISTVGEDYTTIASIRRTGGIVPDCHWAANKIRFTKGAQLTKELGCKYLLTHAGFLDESDPKAVATYVERVKWIRDELKKYDVTLIMETGQETAEQLCEFLKGVDGVYVNFDPANMLQYGMGDPMVAVEKLAPWIRQLHVKDAIPSGDRMVWGKEVPWGEGRVGGKKFVAKLESLGFKGNYVVERESGNPDERARDIALAVERLVK